MRTPFNSTNFQKDLEDICHEARNICFTAGKDLEDAIDNFKRQTTDLIIDLYQKYAVEYPGFALKGDGRPGVNLRFVDNGLNYYPNPQLLNFMDHIKRIETLPLRIFELLMSDLQRYIVVGRTAKECEETIQKEFPHLKLAHDKQLYSVKLPTETSILMDRSGLRYQGE